MDIRGLEAVLAVFEHGSFSNAASALFISQPALTRRVALMERELGARLFLRGPRGVSLTDAGRALIEPARRTLRDIDSIRGAVGLVREGLRGSLSIVGVPNLSSGVLGQLVAQFHAKLPQIEIRVVSAESNTEAATMVEAGVHDLALVELPVTSNALHVTRLVEEDFVVAFAKGQLGSTHSGRIPTVTRDMIHGRTMVHLPATQFPNGRGRQLYQMVGAEPSVQLEVATCGVLVPIIQTGHAIGVIPRTVGMLDRGNGLDLALPPHPITRTIGLARKQGNPAPAAHHFLEIARAAIGINA